MSVLRPIVLPKSAFGAERLRSAGTRFEERLERATDTRICGTFPRIGIEAVHEHRRVGFKNEERAVGEHRAVDAEVVESGRCGDGRERGVPSGERLLGRAEK